MQQPYSLKSSGLKVGSCGLQREARGAEGHKKRHGSGQRLHCARAGYSARTIGSTNHVGTVFTGRGISLPNSGFVNME